MTADAASDMEIVREAAPLDGEPVLMMPAEVHLARGAGLGAATSVRGNLVVPGPGR